MKVGHLVTQSVPRGKALMRKASPAARLKPCIDTPRSGLTSDFRESALGEQAGRRLRREARFGNKPNEPNLRCSKEIQGFRRRQTQASYPPCNLRVTPEKGAIFRKFKCRTPLRIARIRSVVYELQREMGRFWGSLKANQGCRVTHNF